MSGTLEPVDLRSDTLTRPSPAMRKAMGDAPVGDDVYGEDPTVNLLQDRVAALLGKEAALFVPSGTMGNQVSLHTLTHPGDEVIAQEDSHILHYEGGSAAALSGLQIRPLPGALGLLDSQSVVEAIRPTQEHFARTRVVEMENTHNRCGGTVWPLDLMQEIAEVAHAHGLVVHLDGARLWNASVATGTPLEAYAACADSVSVCFSKGLGAPVGSAVAGSRDFVESARFNRKRYGGAMRQAGIIAAGALFALDHNVSRLAEDHDNAVILARFLREVPGLEIPHPVQTNIIIADLAGLEVDAEGAIAALKARGVLCGAAKRTSIRFVTHLDVTRRQVEVAGEVAAQVLSGLSRA